MTRLYLHDAASGQAGRPFGSATTDVDQGHAGPARLVCRKMDRTKGAAAATASCDCVAHPAGAQDLWRIFISPALAAQTLSAGSQFTFAGSFDACAGGDGGGAYEYAWFRIYAYLWRPGVGRVCALFGDTAATNGVDDPDPFIPPPVEPPTWEVVALPALSADIEVRLRDRMVLEVWQYRDTTVTTVAAFQYDGDNDSYEDGDATAADAASYLDCSRDLILAEEASMNSANILVGARDLEVDGANVGALDGGVVVSYEPTHIEHAVDQRMGVQRVDKVAERMTITANLKEATLENLRVAWGQPTYALSTAGAKTILHVGGEQAVTEHTLVLTGKAPGASRTRTITCHKAVAIETSAHSYAKDGATIYPVTFVLVEDATQGDGFKYVSIEDDEGQFIFA